MKTFFTLSFFTVLLFIFSGCSTIHRTKVEFIEPNTMLTPVKLKPDNSEKKGVLLRFKVQNSPLVYNDLIQIYTQIDKDTAIPVEVKKTRTVTVKKDKNSDSFSVTTETKTTESDLRQGIEKIKIDSRGKILEFIKGEFNTKHGKMTFLSHTRGPMFPAKKVAIGDKWSYDEKLEMKFDSTLISRKSEKPDEIKVDSMLTGFALVGGRRCAVISSRTVTKRVEHYSALWKDMTFHVNIYVDETIYFDYKRGVIAGSVTDTDSYSTSKKLDFSDNSRSQSISILEKNINNF